MFPYIGFIHTYDLCIAIGLIASFVLLNFFFKNKYDNKFIVLLEINTLLTVIFGLLSAFFVQKIYFLIEGNNKDGMTFYGGLLFGTIFFICFHYLIVEKKYKNSIKEIVKIAPACITLAHGFGRIGCFFAGCCYGKDSENGLYFSSLGRKVIPTNLYEAIFLFLLSAVLIYLIFKKHCQFTMPIYLLCYGIFRFIIEFFRGDDRGKLFGFISPSQWISIFFIIIAIIYFIILKRKEYNAKKI